jgi:2-C-methyl-D-erythritol 4-phosphate cytidylyltransferase
MMADRKAQPDYADYRDALRPFVRRELLRARIEEARKAAGEILTARVAELAKELDEVNREIGDMFQRPI